MNPDPDLLMFVYGSLRPDADNPMSYRLSTESTDFGQANLCGRLYHLGWYPGIRLSEYSQERVRGCLICLNTPKIIDWLDQYEGYNPISPEESLFVRRRSRVQAGEKDWEAWVYEYNYPVDEKDRIDNGDWLSVGPLDSEP